MVKKADHSENTTDQGLLRGRFSEATDEFVEIFTASISFDQRLYKEDIRGSLAHAQMLLKIKMLTSGEFDQIEGGLDAIKGEIESGKMVWSVALEDVHMNIEHRLIQLIGDTGKKLHTGRSRNDRYKALFTRRNRRNF
jgi:argininosuccinate lyase